MLSDNLLKKLKEDDGIFDGRDRSDYIMPTYSPERHYLDLTKSKYYHALLFSRHAISAVCDYFFGVKHGAKKIDLFMITPSVSSPMGPGSNSVAVPVRFGKLDSFLVDSSQFGFEPLLLNHFSKVYCYLPSMRGEDSDRRHLNQFFHCEAEIVGTLGDICLVVEDFVKTLCFALLNMPNIIRLISASPEDTLQRLRTIIKGVSFPRISFDDAVKILVANGKPDCVIIHDSGRDITALGENELAKLLSFKSPFWLTDFDRDRVPFYQKPHKKNPDKVVNADLLFPQITSESFGGEVVGCGERQNCAEEILVSLKRQGLSTKPYEWYIDLRNQPDYKTTSGFGLGIERFLSWAFCRSDIKDVIVYPRLKDVSASP